MADTARGLVGDAAVDAKMTPVTGGEDFAFMLESRPGAFIFMGNGDTPFCHHPAYDFNDDNIATGSAYWVLLARRYLA